MDSTPNNGKLLFDVGGTFLKAVIADGAGEFLPGTEYSVPMPSDGPREAIEQALVTAVEQGMRSAAERELRIGGLGIAFPGPFDFEHGIPLMSHKFRSVYGISLLDLLRTRTAVGPSMPVLFMHDVNAAMLGEMRCGNARGFANAALISLGTGLGFACCLDGRVQYSPTGSPRITIYKTPFRDGILEDYASKRAFLRIYGEITGRGTEPSLTVADLGRMAGGRGSPRTDPRRTHRVSVAGRPDLPFVHPPRTGSAQRPAWSRMPAAHRSGSPYRTRRLLRAARPYRRFADGSLTPPGRGEFPASRRSGDSADHRTNQMHNL